MVKPFNYKEYDVKRYTVESVFGKRNGGEERVVVYNGNDRERALSTTEFWDAKQDTYFIDNYLVRANETPLERAYRKLDALEQHILSS